VGVTVNNLIRKAIRDCIDRPGDGPARSRVTTDDYRQPRHDAEAGTITPLSER
jgi:hypothetical protein